MQALQCSVVMTYEMRIVKKAKLSVYKTVFVYILTYDSDPKNMIASASVQNEIFYVELKEQFYLMKCIAMKFENL